jgi:hypothetical protein
MVFDSFPDTRRGAALERPEISEVDRRHLQPDPRWIGTSARPPQLAFVYRNRAEKERQNVADGRRGPTGVRLPG